MIFLIEDREQPSEEGATKFNIILYRFISYMWMNYMEYYNIKLSIFLKWLRYKSDEGEIEQERCGLNLIAEF